MYRQCLSAPYKKNIYSSSFNYKPSDNIYLSKMYAINFWALEVII